MVNYREILRLTSLGYSQRQIAASVHSSRSTISEVQGLAKKLELTLPLDDSHGLWVSISAIRGTNRAE